MPNIELYKHQKQFLALINEQRKEGKNVMAQAPTGFGKTLCIGQIATSRSQRGAKTLILVHRAEILWQTIKAFASFNIGVAVVASQSTFEQMMILAVENQILINMRSNVIIAQVQTLTRRIDKMPPKADLVIIDEAHHTAASQWKKITDYYEAQGAQFIGFTATPERLDGLPLARPSSIFDVLVKGKPIKWLVENGYLANPKVIVPQGVVETEGVKTKIGDYDLDKLTDNVDKIVGNAVKEYEERLDGKPVLVFCPSLKSCHNVADEFRKAGYLAETIEGSMSALEREDKLKRIGNGELNLLMSCDLIGEGVDVPAVAGGILLRPTKSIVLYAQMLGRLLRKAHDKTEAIIIDHALNWYRHNKFPHKDREWKFHGRPKKKREAVSAARMIVCECEAIYPATRPKCPECGRPKPYADARETEQIDPNAKMVEAEFTDPQLKFSFVK